MKALRGAKLIVTKCLHLSAAEPFLLIYDIIICHFTHLFVQAAKETKARFESVFLSRRVQVSGKAFDHTLSRSISRAHGILSEHRPSCNQFRIVLTTDRRGAGRQCAHTLNVVRRISSGRKAIFPLGIPDTSRAAAKLISPIGKDDLHTDELAGRLGLSTSGRKRLLSLLYMHGTIEHA